MCVVMGLDTDIVGFAFTYMDPYFLISGDGVWVHMKPQLTATWMEFILVDKMVFQCKLVVERKTLKL